jgi:hypothetical protein
MLMASRLIRGVSPSGEADLGGVEEHADCGSEDDQVEQQALFHLSIAALIPGESPRLVKAQALPHRLCWR